MTTSLVESWMVAEIRRERPDLDESRWAISVQSKTGEDRTTIGFLLDGRCWFVDIFFWSDLGAAERTSDLLGEALQQLLYVVQIAVPLPPTGQWRKFGR